MNFRHVLSIALVCSLSLASVTHAQQGKRINIKQAGAVDDGTTLNTVLLQKTIDEIAATGGGTLVIPPGTYMTGALFLKPGVNVHIEKDGVLKGSPDIANFPVTETRIEGKVQQWIPAVINATGHTGLRITGEGMLNGTGTGYSAAFRTAIAQNRGTKNLDVPRPRLLFLRDCKDVVVSGIQFRDSGFWNFHLYRCDGVVIDGLDISAPPGSPSTDGIDIDSSRNITVKNTRIANNDDCIALKGTKGPLAMDDKDSPPVENIRIENCTFERGNGFITCGSEATIIRNVVVENCRATASAGANLAVLRLKLRTDTPQEYSNMRFNNITLEGNGALISVAPWTQYFDLQGHPQPTRKAHDIVMTNITGTTGVFGSIRPAQGDVLQNFTFENIDIKARTGPNFQGVSNVTFKNVKINGEEYKGAPTTTPAQ
jgi:alpha-L-rhamnosidase